MKSTVQLFLVSVSTLFFFLTTNVTAAEFEVFRPGKLAISRDIKKVFIDPGLFNDTNDKLKIKFEVVVALKRRLNGLGRFEAIIGPPRGFDPDRETVAVIQGDIISGGEIENGQFTEKAECRGGISGLVGAATASDTSQQGITFSRRGMLCKKPNLESQLAEVGLSAGLSMLGVREFPRLDEVIRIYKYKNFSLFAQVNLSLTQIGQERETLAITADAASFSRHVISPGSYHNVRESGDNAALIWLWFNFKPIAPVVIRDIGVVQASNPGSGLGKWYDRSVPHISDIPKRERTEIITNLVNKALTEFVRTISPYREKIQTEIASGGNKHAIENLEKGQFQKAKQILQGAQSHPDLYNLGLAFEATARTLEDYEDALLFYSQALDQSPETKLYAQGIGRMELQLRIANRLKQQTVRN